MPRIGIDLQPLQTRHSRGRGIGRYVQAVIERLLANPSAVDYRLYTNPHLPEPELRLAPGLKYQPLPFEDEAGGINEVIFKAALISDEVDALFMPSPFEMIEAVVPEFEAFPARLYTICYDLIPLVFADRYLTDRGIRDAYLQRMRNLKHSDTIFAISEATRQDTIRYVGTPADRVINVSGGVSSFFIPVPEGEREAWRATLARKFGIIRPFVLYTGGEDWRKNMEGLIEGYALLPAAVRRNHQLVIACKLSALAIQRMKEQGRSRGLAADELIFTDFVSDEELRALYSLCRLFAFPSFYEGFGLPLVEALACGAPVLTANNSCLREIVPDAEQTFDAASASSIGDCLNRHLSDDALLARLREGAIDRAAAFSWDRIAARIAEVIEATPPREQTNMAFRRLAETEIYGGTKPRVAYFSPFLPLESGISDYTEELLDPLATFCELDLYADDGYTPLAAARDDYQVFPGRRFPANLERYGLPCDVALYQMGNSQYHAYMFALLQRFAGITVLHDYCLGGLLNHAEVNRPALGISLERELEHSHGTEMATRVMKDLREGKYYVSDFSRLDININRRIFTRSLGVIVHSQWAYEKAVRERGADCEFITRVPHLLSLPPKGEDHDEPDEALRLRRKWGVPSDAFIFGAFGVVAPSKRPDTILDAFRTHLAGHPDAYLLFVGPVVMTGDFMAEVARRGLTDRVKITGYIEELSSFYELLRLCDVTVNLRYPFGGETSGALLRMLAVGKPSIVTDIGSFTEYSSEVVHKVPPPDRGDEVAAVVEAFRALTENTEYRRKLAENAVAYVRREHDPDYCARLYSEFITAVLASPRTRTRLLADWIGREAARAAAPGEPEKLFAPFRSILMPTAETK